MGGIAPQAEVRTRKSPLGALGLSLAGTIVPTVVGAGVENLMLVAVGLSAGPGLGHLYADRSLWFFIGSTLRLVVLLALFGNGYT